MAVEPREAVVGEREVPGKESVALCLYVTGATPGSSRAVACLKGFCEKFLKGRYALEVIDVYQQPHLAEGDRILATPTLIRKFPLPLRRLVGDLSDPQRLLTGLGVQPGS
jgi:circadian clock protein KaiB